MRLSLLIGKTKVATHLSQSIVVKAQKKIIVKNSEHSGRQLRRGSVPECTLLLPLAPGPLYSVLSLTSAWNVLSYVSYLITYESFSSFS